MSVEGPLPLLQPGECDHVRVASTENGTPYGERRCLDCGQVLPPGPARPPRWRAGDGTVTMAPPDPQQLAKVLADCRHELVTLHGLHVHDGDPAESWQISTAQVVARIDGVLLGQPQVVVAAVDESGEVRRLRAALVKIHKGIWTGPNSVETILWMAERALEGHEVK